jgi:hypothetical protein
MRGAVIKAVWVMGDKLGLMEVHVTMPSTMGEGSVLNQVLKSKSTPALGSCATAAKLISQNLRVSPFPV